MWKVYQPRLAASFSIGNDCHNDDLDDNDHDDDDLNDGIGVRVTMALRVLLSATIVSMMVSLTMITITMTSMMSTRALLIIVDESYSQSVTARQVVLAISFSHMLQARIFHFFFTK